MTAFNTSRQQQEGNNKQTNYNTVYVSIYYMSDKGKKAVLKPEQRNPPDLLEAG